MTTVQILQDSYRRALVDEHRPGLALAALPVPTAKLVQLVLTVRQGSGLETEQEAGLTSLLGTLLSRGCRGWERREFAEMCDSRGVSLEVYPGRDSFTVELTMLPEDLAWGVETVVAMLTEPTLESEQFEIAREEHLQQLAARADEQRLVLMDRSREAVFAAGHCYARPLLGSEQTLKSFQRGDLQKFQQRLLLGPAPLCLCVAGRFDEDHLLRLVERHIAPLCRQRHSPRSPFPVVEPYNAEAAGLTHLDFPFEQSRILIGFPALRRSEPSYLEAAFANEVLGGAFTSRLTRAVRSKEGLAYSAGSRIWAGQQGGCLWMSLQTDHANVPRALKTLRATIDQVLQSGLPPQEFEQFKSFALSSLPFDYDSLSSWCSRFLEFFLYGAVWQPDLRHQEIHDRVTPGAVQQVLERLLMAEKANVCLLGRPHSDPVEAYFFEASTAEDIAAYAPPALGASRQPLTSEGPAATHEVVSQGEQATLVRYQNGVHLLCLPRPELLSISLQVWSLTGSMDEPQGKSGMSHFLEHLMFRGTERFPDGEFDTILTQRGGLNNAFTSEDFTVYTDYVVMAGLEEALCLEADRFAHLRIEDEVFQTEKDVVLEERSLRVDSHPLGNLYEQVQSRAFKDHPYGPPVIGWRKELEELTPQDLTEHYHKARRPERLMVVVAGGCPKEKAIELVGRTLGRELGNGQSPDPIWPHLVGEEPVTAVGPEEIRLQERSGYSYLVSCFRFPREGHPDYEAAEILSRILGHGDSSRLHDTFVRERQRALEVWLSYEAQTRDHPLLHLGLATTNSLEDGSLRKELEEFLNGLADNLTQKELDKARRGWLADVAFTSDELEDWALETAASVLLLPWDEVWKATERVSAVTLEQVQNVCRRYLNCERAVFGSLRATGSQAPRHGA